MMNIIIPTNKKLQFLCGININILKDYKYYNYNVPFKTFRSKIGSFQPTLRGFSDKVNSNDKRLSHIDQKTGQAKMVDVSEKDITQRIAKAQAHVSLSLAAFHQIRQPDSLNSNNSSNHNINKKGDVLTVAQLAGIQGAKRTSDLIPLCHPLLLDKISIHFVLKEEKDKGKVIIVSEVRCNGRTGVEMEALTAVTTSALTIIDMCKAVDPRAIISDIKVLAKKGGKSKDWEIESN